MVPVIIACSGVFFSCLYALSSQNLVNLFLVALMFCLPHPYLYVLPGVMSGWVSLVGGWVGGVVGWWHIGGRVCGWVGGSGWVGLVMLGVLSPFLSPPGKPPPKHPLISPNTLSKHLPNTPQKPSVPYVRLGP